MSETPFADRLAHHRHSSRTHTYKYRHKNTPFSYLTPPCGLNVYARPAMMGRGTERERERAGERDSLFAGAYESGLVIFDYRWSQSVSRDGDKRIDLLSVTKVTAEVTGVHIFPTRCPRCYKGQICTACSIDLLRGR